MKRRLDEKASRLLADGNVSVIDIDAMAKTVSVVVRGDHGDYAVEFAGGAWSCSCPARRTCAHLLAVRRITGVDL